MKISPVQTVSNNHQTFQGWHTHPKLPKSCRNIHEIFMNNNSLLKKIDKLQRPDINIMDDKTSIITLLKGCLSGACGMFTGAMGAYYAAITGALTTALGAALTAGGLFGGIGIFALTTLLKKKKTNTSEFLAILQDKAIRNDLYDGSCFDYKIDEKGNSLLTKFFDIIPNKDNQSEYNKIIEILSNVKNINYNQRDEHGISILEKILNAENLQGLKLVKDFEFPYRQELDSAYEFIIDEQVKRYARMLNIKFTHQIEALKKESPAALDAAIEEMHSPFCKQQIELAKEMLDYAAKNCSRNFIIREFCPRFLKEGLLEADIYELMHKYR